MNVFKTTGTNIVIWLISPKKYSYLLFLAESSSIQTRKHGLADWGCDLQSSDPRRSW